MPKPMTTPSDLPVTVLPLADLTPYPRNPRVITPAAVNAVAVARWEAFTGRTAAR